MVKYNKKTFSIIAVVIIIFLGAVKTYYNVKLPGEQDANKASVLEDVNLILLQPDGDSSYILHLVAIEKGYFAEQGINLIANRRYGAESAGEVKNLPDGGDLYLMGRGKTYAIEAAHPGLIKIFNINTQDQNKWNDAILVNKSLDINSLSQLGKNQPIGLLGESSARISIMNILLKNNSLNPDDYVLISEKMPDTDSVASRVGMIDDTLARANIVYAREPYLSLVSEKNNWKRLIDEPLFAKNIFNPWIMNMTVFSTKFLKEKPVLAQKIVAAYDKAVLFIREHPEEAQAILSKYAREKYGSRTLNVRMINYSKSDEISWDLVRKQSDWYFENGYIDNKIDARSLIYFGSETR